MYVCICHPITDKQIKQVLVEGAQTTAAVFRHFGHKVQCGKCVPYVRGMVEEHCEANHTGGCGGDCGQCGCGEPKASNDAEYAYGIAAE
ncbi:MAG TPA: (2Fe-2S)-binding protein [Azospirillum sp.]|nr:(2Fe-2S)-binding protein [Azospirillum sp.]